ncbi:50S ribosomal protein L37e [Candidatus Woesearchaeota archaeon]|nr:50S ribosomal protein L37e [Candidatus Woesearchaeota archaeon]
MGFKCRGGTGTQGMHSSGKTHIACRRCGKHSYHIRKKTCASCGYGNSSKFRRYGWQTKTRVDRRRILH